MNNYDHGSKSKMLMHRYCKSVVEDVLKCFPYVEVTIPQCRNTVTRLKNPENWHKNILIVQKVPLQNSPFQDNVYSNNIIMYIVGGAI